MIDPISNKSSLEFIELTTIPPSFMLSEPDMNILPQISTRSLFSLSKSEGKKIFITFEEPVMLLASVSSLLYRSRILATSIELLSGIFSENKSFSGPLTRSAIPEELSISLEIICQLGAKGPLVVYAIKPLSPAIIILLRDDINTDFNTMPVPRSVSLEILI